MKEMFTTPEMEVIKFSEEDVITTSGCGAQVPDCEAFDYSSLCGVFDPNCKTFEQQLL